MPSVIQSCSWVILASCLSSLVFPLDCSVQPFQLKHLQIVPTEQLFIYIKRHNNLTEAMCYWTGYRVYCKQCGIEIRERSTTRGVECDKVKEENWNMCECGTITDLRKDWQGICLSCQAVAANGVKQGDDIDKKWARGSAGGW